MPSLSPPSPERWINVRPEGLYVVPGDFYVDPVRAVERAVITHGHSDHARTGHRRVLATTGTLAVMRLRLGPAAVAGGQAAAYGETVGIGPVSVRLVPAGHVLGSAQVVLEHAGCRVVVSGDYKRRADRTCPAFEPVPCDVFVTEATFGLPVFRHPPDHDEVGRLLTSLRVFPERSHVVGVYALGKCQRLLTLLRAAGYDRPVYVSAALAGMCRLYQDFGVDLGVLRPVEDASASALAGAVVLAPPGGGAGDWGLRLTEPVIAAASGWMRVRRFARQRGTELPLIISDHADWPELVETLDDVGAPAVWVTHGQEAALVQHARQRGIDARALSLVGFAGEGAE